MKIVLLKDPSSSSRDYEEVLGKVGYSVEYKPLLQRFPILDDQRFYLIFTNAPHESGYAGLVVTSQNAFEALYELLVMGNVRLHSGWRDLPVYCVGPSTSVTGKKVGFENCVGGNECGSAELLAKFIIARDRYSVGRLLFLTGDKTKSTIVDRLTEAGNPIDQLKVYETRNIAVDLQTSIPTTCVLVLFSPSGLQSLDHSQIKAYKWIAIGPSSYQALKDVDIESVQAPTPTPDGVLTALSKL